jgi:hypothetical protein
MQAKLIPNPWLQVEVRAEIVCSQLLSFPPFIHLCPLHFAFSPFNSKFIIYDKVYEQGISMLSEGNTYPVQGGR